ncbi:IclR family transcriptional regulator [Haloplanus sp. GCM10025708]|uniref:IclR family transcriptional regulator n=1 Tax=Haloplanus sp. GCM10025708 TaxID=3252679 RepID=UPI00361CE1CC
MYATVQPKIISLAEETQERAQFFVEEHGKIIYVHRVTGANGVDADSRLGRRLPITATAAGKVILAHLPDDRVAEILDDHGFPDLTENTITDREAFLEHLETVRERGYGLNDEEYIKGLRVVSVPVMDPGGDVVGAISVSGPTYRLDDGRFTETLPKKIKATANEIELNSRTRRPSEIAASFEGIPEIRTRSPARRSLYVGDAYGRVRNVGRIYETAGSADGTRRTNATNGGGPMSDTRSPRQEDAPNDDDHLADVPAGSGCTEIWEHLSERREAASRDD